MSRARRQRSAKALLKIVQTMFLREILTFEGERHVALRVDGEPPDRSVLAVARFGDGDSLAIARVCESDLDEDPDRAMHLVYLTGDDFELIRVVAPRKRATARRRRR